MWNFSFKNKRLDESPPVEDYIVNGTNKLIKENEKMSDKMNFDMIQIGRNIAAFRKARNMTQMNLADELNISFQAVSNWERGQTMPDISKLPELASILDCTIDELLGNGRSAEVVKHIVADQPIEKPISLDELSAVAPALEPSRTEEIFAESVKEEPNLDWEALEELAPFLDQATLYQVVTSALDKGVEIEDISSLAPFLGRAGLGEITRRLMDEGYDFSDLESLAPFMDRSDLGELVRRHLANGGEIGDLAGLAPFLDREHLGKLVLRAIDQGDDIDEITSLAPFLNRADLGKIVKHFLDKGGNPREMMGLAPFLDKEMLRLILGYTFGNKDN